MMTKNLCKGGIWVLLFCLFTLALAKPATQPEQLADNQIGFSTQSDQRKQLTDVADYFKMLKLTRTPPSPRIDDLNSTTRLTATHTGAISE